MKFSHATIITKYISFGVLPQTRIPIPDPVEIPAFYTKYTGSYRLPERGLIEAFDPFDCGLPRYSFFETCEESINLKLGSGTAKIFINTTADQSTLSEETRNLFEYINSGTAGDTLTRKLDSAVRLARMDSEMRAVYMRTSVFYQDAIREGKAEGREEGRAEGEAIMISRLLNKGKSYEEIAAFFDYTVDQVKELVSVLTNEEYI